MWTVEFIELSGLWGVYYNGVLQSTAEDETEARDLVAVLNAQKEETQ